MKLTANNLFSKIEKQENEDIKRYLLQEGVDIVDEYGRTPLLNAAFYDNYELAEWLLEKGAQKDIQDNGGFTALHFAAQEANLNTAKVLLKNKANPNIEDHHGNTPSWVAVMNWKSGKNFDLLKELMYHHADLTIKNNAGKSTEDLIPDTIMSKLKE